MDERRCSNCNENAGFDDGNDGFYYCRLCGSQSEEMIDTAGLSEHLLSSGIYLHRRRVKVEQPSPYPRTPNSNYPNAPTATQQEQEQARERMRQESQKPFSFIFEDDVSKPLDFGNAWMNQTGELDKEAMLNALCLRYTQGIQVLIQLQCQVLVEQFDVTPVICGLCGVFWLRFLATSRIFDKEWAQAVIRGSERELEQSGVGDTSKPREAKTPKPRRYKAEPRDSHGRRLVMIWSKFLKRKMPLRTSLAVCFLACHVAREAILPTDLSKWACEGKLPYMSAFLTIEKLIGGPSRECPLTSRALFWPRTVVDPTIIETHAASIADNIGLLLPPVNFYAIACRYLEQLSLPTEKILSHAFRIYEWSMPPDLWLSTNIGRLPTRVCVMSLLIVAMRILYNINGYGNWENSFIDQVQKKLATPAKSPKKACRSKENNPIINSSEMEMDMKPGKCSFPTQRSDMDTTELLCHLEKAYDKLVTVSDYSKDLFSYLKYCKDVVFVGRKTSYEEDNFIEQLWTLYENQQDIKPSVEHGKERFSPTSKREENITNRAHSQLFRDGNITGREMGPEMHITKSVVDDNQVVHISSSSGQSHHIPFEPLRRIMSDMELNNFRYLPPRTRSKFKPGYICLERKTLYGRRIYVADADYYILLRACARVAEIDIRIMHLGMLKLEKRLLWIEQQIDAGLKIWPKFSFKGYDTDLPDTDIKPKTSCEEVFQE